MIVDDHAIVRQGLTQLIETGNNMKVCKKTASGREAVSVVSADACDLVLLDISLTETI